MCIYHISIVLLIKLHSKWQIEWSLLRLSITILLKLESIPLIITLTFIFYTILIDILSSTLFYAKKGNLIKNNKISNINLIILVRYILNR